MTKSKNKTTLILAITSTIAMAIYAQFVLGYYSKCFKLLEGPNSLGLTLEYSVSEVLHFFKSRDS